MAELRFELDRMDPEGARGPELRATWARLRVLVDGHAISRAYDANAQTVRDDLFIPLYPLAEWLVSHWWQLLYEIRAPNRTTLRGYDSRHLLANGHEGFALPHLSGETEAILRAGESIAPELAEEFFGSVDVVHLIEQSERISEFLQFIERMDVVVADLNALRGFFAGHTDGGLPPWKQGYQVARLLRGELGLDSRPIASEADLASAFHVDAGHLDKVILVPPGDLANLDALVGYNQARHPGFVIGQRRDVDRRFAFCRGLFEHVASPHPVPALVTRARTEAQKRNRAFAAEFLVPASALRERLESELIAEDDLDLLADEFGVSSAVVRHQLENHGIGRIQTDA